MKIKNITCKILINGRDATEYSENEYRTGGGENNNNNNNSNNNNNNTSTTKTCHIASEFNQPFAFHIDLNDPSNYYQDYEYWLSCDGESCGGTYSKVIPGLQPTIWDKSRKPVPNSRTCVFEEREFKFGKCDTVESVARGSDVENRADVLKEIGTLKVEIWRTMYLGAAATVIAPKPDSAATGNSTKKPILEKQLKGRSVPMRTVLGEASYNSRPSCVTRRIEPSVATFIFKYSSKESLQMQGIVPDTPSVITEAPISSSSVNRSSDGSGGSSRLSLEEMTPAQLREELRRLRNEADAVGNREKKRQRIEVDLIEDIDRRRKIKKEIKTEVVRRGRSRAVIPKGKIETIDLTDD